MAEFLLELLSEDIPASMQKRGAMALQKLLAEGLREAGLEPTATRALWTPRRLLFVADGVATQQPDRVTERKGPRVDAPAQAIAGFLKSAGLDSLDACERREGPKGAFWFAVMAQPGRATAELLPELIADAVNRLVWPKSMRFANTGFRWVRPLQGVLALFNGKTLSGGLDLQGETLNFSAQTEGHRFLAPARITVRDFADYAAKLKKAFVIPDGAERAAMITAKLESEARKQDLQPVPDDSLLAEVANLAEWPDLLIGHIDDGFMDLPPELLRAAMRRHQKYFSLCHADGSPAPRFAVVANMPVSGSDAASRRRAATVREGNERVLRARLSDAAFFRDQDRKTRLEDLLPGLEKVIFHERLGSLAARVRRMVGLAGYLAPRIAGCTAPDAARAALLAKADLLSHMVREFPELQGMTGRTMALEEGEVPAIAGAIRDHYSPAGPSDSCPSEPLSIAVALADKLDLLAGFWLIDERPTGSKDPFALRRAALGVIRLILENRLADLPLRPALTHAVDLYAPGDAVNGTGPDAAIDGLMAFIAERLKVHYRDAGERHDIVAAAFALEPTGDLVRLQARIAALADFLDGEAGADLLIAYRRTANILKAESRHDAPGSVAEGDDPDPSLFSMAEETALHTALNTADAHMGAAFAQDLSALALLREPVDCFFDRVTVNAKDGALRLNRLRLLAALRLKMRRIADFDLIGT